MHLYSKVHVKDHDEILVVRGEFHEVLMEVHDAAHVVHEGVHEVCGEFHEVPMEVHAGFHDVVPVVRGEFHWVHEEAQSNHETHVHVHKKVCDGSLREAQG